MEISRPSQLRLQDHRLRIEQDAQEVGNVPLEDLGVLVLAHPAINLSQALLAACAAADVAVVVCDNRYLPSSLLVHWAAHSLHPRILRDQIRATQPRKKRLWKLIVQAKIEAQARALECRGENATALMAMSARVRSGDPDNAEARAAQYYWRALFGPDFRRNPDLPGINVLLNYGYAVVRACVARAVVGAGLHPALGIMHSNQFNHFALADDLMEPLRPMVDLKVLGLRDAGTEDELTPAVKKELLGLTAAQVCSRDRRLPLMVALSEYAAAVRDLLQGIGHGLPVPR